MDKKLKIFNPVAVKQAELFKDSNKKFVHYTSAEAALNIIRTQKIWMRNANLMNDFSEIRHGTDCLSGAWFEEGYMSRLSKLLEPIEKGLLQRLTNEIDTRQNERFLESYILSISEHGSEDKALDEDKYGRLSMWRAYGGTNNVAMVLNPEVLLGDANPYNAFIFPVQYENRGSFKLNFEKVICSLENNFDYIKGLDSEEVFDRVYMLLHSSILTIKHPGFKEEKEWRLIYSPTIYPSGNVEDNVETINGLPQKIYKLALKDHPEINFNGATIPDLLDKIIIGPNSNPWPISEAFIHELENINVKNARQKVITSSIPLRR